MTNNHSLKKHLISWIGLPILVAALFILLISYIFTRHEIEEVYDAQLVHSAKVLLQLTQHEIIENENFYLGIENPNLQHEYERNLGFRVWSGDEIITQSKNAEKFGAFDAPPGFSDQHVNGHKWRFFVFIDTENKIKIEVSELYNIRYELIIQLMFSLLLPAMIFLPIIMLIIFFGVQKILKPVIKISLDVNNRNVNDLSSIKDDKIPKEIVPLVDALNKLFMRIEESFNREKQFSDNAAHELRTPLAAIKTQAQVLMKKAGNMPDCQEGLENLNAAVDRAAHMIDQLLSFSRLQSEHNQFDTVNLSAITQEIIKELSPLALKKKITIEADINPDITIKGNENSLRIMVRNLMENAVKFTPADGRVNIAVSSDNQLSHVKISDTGPGIDNAEKQKVFERFYRVQKNKQGSGLGLSMVKWVCDIHGAQISLNDNNPHGLIVDIGLRHA